MLTEILIFLATSFFAYSLYAYRRAHNIFRENGVKFLPGVPIFGNSYKSALQIQHLTNDFSDVYKAFPDEKYVGFLEGMLPVLLIRDPELVKQITVKDFDHFVDHRLYFGEDLFSDTMFSMKGDKWRDMRTTMSPAFTGSRMKLMMPFMIETSFNSINYLKETEGQEIDVDDVVRRYNNDVIASTAFGLTVDSFKDPNNEFFTTGQRLVNFSLGQRVKMLAFAVCPSLSRWFPMFDPRVTTFFRDLVKNTIKHREDNNILRNDMIHLLIEAKKGTLKSASNSEKDEIGFATTEDITFKNSRARDWSADELAAQAFIFFFAGFEASASAISFTIHELALNPEVQEKLYQEIKTMSKSLNGGNITYDAIKNLKYLDDVTNESLRKWTAGGAMDRLCGKSFLLPSPREGGTPYMLKPNEGLYVPVQSIQNDEKYFPNPQKFDPDRFSDENKTEIKQYTFMPFGIGPRNCIGSRFALLNLKVFMYYLMLNFKIHKCGKTRDPIKVRGKDINMRCEGGTWVKFSLRV